MRILLDTCVLSEVRKPRPEPAVRRAIEAEDDENLFLSVVSIGEITKGISLLRESENKRVLTAWLGALEKHYSDRILSIDVETSRIWGELTAGAQQAGSPLGAMDGLIAATARRHGLHVMTRNTADFAATGVLLVNPWPGR